MKENNNHLWIKLICVVLFLLFLFLVIFGQKQIGYAGLTMMIVGLSGILFLLFLYNRKHQ